MKASMARKLTKEADNVRLQTQCRLILIYGRIESAARQGKSEIEFLFDGFLQPVSHPRVVSRVIEKLKEDGYAVTGDRKIVVSWREF